MANKMLIDSSHPEETRVVVTRGNKVEEFDFESASRRQLRGNIYLAKVTRVEPSLQAAFIEYGGNRHGFLAFSEIHPDYYQIPVADRQALLEEDARAERDLEREAERPRGRRRRGASRRRHERDATVSAPASDFVDAGEQLVGLGERTEQDGDFVGAESPGDDTQQEGRPEEALEAGAGRSALPEAIEAPSETTADVAASSFRPTRGGQGSPQTEALSLESEEGGGETPAASPSDAAPGTRSPCLEPADPAAQDEPRRSSLRRRSGATRRGTRTTRRRTMSSRSTRSSSRSAGDALEDVRSGPRSIAGTIRSRRSSSAARSCSCRSSRRSAATRARH
jgi:ribonuclease E